MLQLLFRKTSDDTLLTKAIEDLNVAIRDADAQRDVKTLRAALSQRAFLLRKLDAPTDLVRKDAERAAKLGDPLAARLAVALNPYAAMCNAMLDRAMKDSQGESSCCDEQRSEV